MGFKLSIETVNDAFQDGERNTELDRILREIADELSGDSFDNFGALRGAVLDSNGNTVGEWTLDELETDEDEDDWAEDDEA